MREVYTTNVEEVFPTTKATSKNSAAMSKKSRTATKSTKETPDKESWDITIMRKIFYAAQYLQKSQKCVQSLYKIIKEVKFEVFYEEFCRNVKCILQYDFENPKVKYVLDMIATFMISIKNENLLKNKVDEDTFDEIGLELFGKDSFFIATISKTYKNILDYILNDALIPFLNSMNVSTRLNTLYLVRKILDHVEDIQFDIYERLKSVLIDRICDKNVRVRQSAVFTIRRFQNIDDPEDKVILTLKFHLNNDIAHGVRLACLNVIYPTEGVIPVIISKTRDIKSKIRETAFNKISKKINIKDLSINERLILLNNGFKDRHETVKKTVKALLVPAWIKAYDDDIIELLSDLEVDKNVDVISKFLEIVFQYLFSIKIEKRTKLHLVIERFYDEYLDDQSLLHKTKISQESCVFWRCLGAFLKNNEDELLKYQPDLEQKLNLRKEINSLLEAIDDLDDEDEKLNSTNCEPEQSTSRQQQDDDENKTESDEQTQQSIIEKELKEENELIKNPIDQILPNLSNFVSFFKEFCLEIDRRQTDPEDNLSEFEFIFKEFCLFLDNYEIVDDSQKQLVINLAEEIIMLEDLSDKFNEYIEYLMKFLSKSVIKTNEELLEYTVNITNKVEESLETEPSEEDLPVIDPKEIRKLELTFAREAVGLHDLKDKLDEALVRREYDCAHGFKQQIEVIEDRLANIKHEINRMQNISIRQRSEPEIEIDIKDHPKVHVKLLQIFGCCLRFGNFRNLTSMMDTRITKYILPGITSIDERIRYYALKALNYACFLSSSLSAQFCTLYHEICYNDKKEVKKCALQGLIDALVEHGLHILYPNDNEVVQQQHQQSEQIENTFLTPLIEQMESEATGSGIKKSILNKSEITTPNLSFVENEQEEINLSRLHYNTNNESDLDKDENEDQQEDDELNERQADLTMKSQIIDQNRTANKTALQLEKEEIIIKQLTKFLLHFLRDNDEDIKSTTVQGICKLLLLGRIYSPLLLSELILLWYNSSTTLPIQHDIGTFLPIYCLASATYKIEIPENYSGQHCLLECFMSTVENVYRLERGEQLEISFDLMRSNYYDSDIDILNVIDFMLNLLEPSNHVKVAIEFCKRILNILQIQRDDEFELKEQFITKYLIKSLKSFKLFMSDEEQIDELKSLIQAIQNEKRYLELKKDFISNIEKFSQKFID